MPDFFWNSSYLVGHPEMDPQHEELAALLNELLHCQQTQCPAEEALSILDRLIAQTAEHFACEDRLMRDCGYPAIAAHTREHEELVRQITVFRGELVTGQRGLSSASLLYLKQWLLNHIHDSDRELADFIAHPATQS